MYYYSSKGQVQFLQKYSEATILTFGRKVGEGRRLINFKMCNYIPGVKLQGKLNALYIYKLRTLLFLGFVHPPQNKASIIIVNFFSTKVQITRK